MYLLRTPDRTSASAAEMNRNPVRESFTAREHGLSPAGLIPPSTYKPLASRRMTDIGAPRLSENGPGRFSHRGRSREGRHDLSRAFFGPDKLKMGAQAWCCQALTQRGEKCVVNRHAL